MKLKLVILVLFWICKSIVMQAQNPCGPQSIQLDLLKNIDGSCFNSSLIPDDKPILLMMFNPTCGHCEDMLDSINSHKFVFKDYTILSVFPNSIDMISFFKLLQSRKSYNSSPNWKFLITDDAFFKPYAINHLPFMVLYFSGIEHKINTCVPKSDSEYPLIKNYLINNE